MKRLLLFLLSFVLSFSLTADNLADAWKALERQDRKQARSAFEKAMKNPATSAEAAIALALLNNVENQYGNRKLIEKALPQLADPSPYIYALWFDEGVTGGQGKKGREHLEYLKNLLDSDRINESVRASGHYILGTHYMFSNDITTAAKYWRKVHSLKEWQFCGPFDNISGSGFFKNYPPMNEPAPEARFLSATNSEIYWFSPKYVFSDPWIATSYHITAAQGVVYAQTFVTSPDDRYAIIAAGGYGDFRVWVNDMYVFDQEEEMRTDLDVYKRRVKLNKGANRILLQVGYTSVTDYPNFIVRLLDDAGQPMKELTHSSANQPYTKGTTDDLGELITHFAEVYFERKIAKDPENVLHYLLRAKTLGRRGKYSDALRTLKKAEAFAPNNLLLQIEILHCYDQMDNRTELLRQFDKVRRIDASLAVVLIFDIEISLSNEDYQEAAELMAQLEQITGKESINAFDYRIRLLSAKGDYPGLLETINAAYKKYPNHSNFVSLKYLATRNIDPDPMNATKILEDYLKENYDGELYSTLIDEYAKQGNKNEVEKLHLLLHEMFPADLRFMNVLAKHYFVQENYLDAMEYIEKQLANAPFNSPAWQSRGQINEALGKKAEAESDYKKAVHYNPNLFEVREKLRELQGKKTMIALFKRDNPYSAIQSALHTESNAEGGFEYIFNDRNVAVFSEGASVEYMCLAVKMLNAQGVKQWTESNIGYNPSRQRLIIEKAEVVKKNGQKIPAEQNDNEIVFTSLEPGDAVLVIYKLQNYTGGRLAKEFWDNHGFTASVPMNESTYRLLVPKGFDLHIVPVFLGQQPAQSAFDEFTLYEWQFKSLEAMKKETFKPGTLETGMALLISSIGSWQTISDWYRDIALPMAKEDFHVNQVYDNIFKGKTFASDLDRARAIYDYICENIRYSSVPFRQSDFVPQKPSTTVSTQLGDCKDLSLLYHALAGKAGLKTNLVLVNTRTENGENALKVPSVDFNHCIIKIDLPDRAIFQELTDEQLPFGAIPNEISGAQALIIPNTQDAAEGENLIHIPYRPIHTARFFRQTSVVVQEEDFIVNTEMRATGPVASGLRHAFLGLSEEETWKKLEQAAAGPFKNHVELQDYYLDNLDSREPEFAYRLEFSVENERINIAGFKAVKPPFYEVIFTLDNFPNEERKFPLLYWLYETVDHYRTEITFHLPEGSEIVELPETVNFDNDFIAYTLETERIDGNTVKVIRTVNTKRKTVEAEDYKAFRETIKQIVAAEDKYLVFR